MVPGAGDGDHPCVSVIVVSRGRPAALGLLLKALDYLDFPGFEVVVVADASGVGAVRRAGLEARVKLAQVNEANISAARNRGLALAAGDIVAFIDDDAVPEPTWLSHLIAPFAEPRVAAAGGFVRGRNGISFQWQARQADRRGGHAALDVDAQHPTVLTADAGHAIMTEGTNCAFRRDVLAGLGGFDEGFHYYLDETDVNFRLSAAGHATAIVPLAQVHHGYAASGLRTTNRAPRSLHEIGASVARFAAKHGDPAETPATLAAFRAGQRRRLLEFMVAGALEPFDVPRLLATLEAGFVEGAARVLPTAQPPLPAPAPAFLPYAQNPAPARGTLIAARPARWRAARLEARRRAALGEPVTLMRLSYTGLFHRLRFHPDGYWLHRGGVFGRAGRDEPVFRITSLRARVRAEVARLVDIRPLARILVNGHPFECS